MDQAVTENWVLTDWTEIPLAEKLFSNISLENEEHGSEKWKPWRNTNTLGLPKWRWNLLKYSEAVLEARFLPGNTTGGTKLR